MIILDSPTWHNLYLFYCSCMELMVFIQPFPVYSDLVSEILKAIQNWTWFGKNNTKSSTQLWTLHFCCCYGVLRLLIHGIAPFPCPCRNVERSDALHLPWPLKGRWGGGCHSTACPPLDPQPPSPWGDPPWGLAELLHRHADLASFVVPLPGCDLPLSFSGAVQPAEQGGHLPGWILTTATSV